MKKEYLVAIAIALFIFAYVLDWISGPVLINVRNPFEFLRMDIISKYPFTTVSIAIRAVAIITSVLLAFSTISKQQLAKGSALLVISALTELYSLQQITTGMRLISIQWTLSMSVAGLGLIPPGILYIIFGVLYWGHEQISGEIYKVDLEPKSETEEV